MKKSKLTSLFILLGFIFYVMLSSWNPMSNEIPEVFEQHPPEISKFWVQKLKGRYASRYMILHAQMESDFSLPSTLQTYIGKQRATRFKDNGRYPDKKANDGIYAAYIKQNPWQFIRHYNNKLNRIIKKGHTLNFSGHLGELVSSSEITKFDFSSFINSEQTPIDPLVVSEPECDENDIIKHKSLLITDLRVVEDPARTYNIIEESGNPLGAWTFGQLMKNMAGENASDQKIRDFLKTWVQGIAAEYQIGDRVGTERDEESLFLFVIKPWLLKAIGQTSYNNTVTMSNWQNLWQTVNINQLLMNAPFKLTAIINRLDLRGNPAYSNAHSNSGETRFIFSLISAYNYDINNNRYDWQIGMPPIHKNTNFAQDFPIDWQGMNVILEYGNVEQDKCDVKQRAQDWIALSSYDFDNASELQLYLNDLQALTNDVTAAGAAPNRVNGSAINQVRTNEKLLAVAPGLNDAAWEQANWQLRQFELDEETALLVNAPVTNVPLESQNVARNNHTFSGLVPDSYTVPDWIYGVNQVSNKNRVKNGNHNLPAELLEPVAELKDELMHYYEFEYWDGYEPQEFSSLFSQSNYWSVSSEREKEIQRQLSLNTCQGCHGGETKTAFTMVRPLGYGQEANYWDAIPASTTGNFDARFYNGSGEEMNTGETWDESLEAPVDNFKPQYYVGDQVTVPNVSPFLTGRNFRGFNADGSPNWQDDFYSDVDDRDNQIGIFGSVEDQYIVGDNQLTGMFYVNNPANRSGTAAGSGPFPKAHEHRIGFNELERRKEDLCLLANSCCLGFVACSEDLMQLVQQMDFVPLPKGGH